jgi:hypothetical protein
MTALRHDASPAHLTTDRPVPRWAETAARLAALTPVLSTIWRLPLMFGAAMGMDAAFMQDMMSHPFWLRFLYLSCLGVLSDGLALLTFALVRPWGERFPRWAPGVAGRRVPVLLVAAPAVVGGVAATAITVATSIRWSGKMNGWNGWSVLMTGPYAPLLLWGPLVLIVTAHYVSRRRLSSGEEGRVVSGRVAHSPAVRTPTA